MKPFIGIVLAGGRSSRMGQDKALLALGKSDFLSQAVARLKPFCQQVWVNGNYPEFDCIADAESFAGPLAGIESCLTQLLEADACGLLIIPVDMPLLSELPIEQLVQQAKQSPAQALAYEQSLFPLYLPLNSAVLAEIARLMQSANRKEHSIHNLLKCLNTQFLAYDDAAELMNINTPEQYRASFSNPTSPQER